MSSFKRLANLVLMGAAVAALGMAGSARADGTNGTSGHYNYVNRPGVLEFQGQMIAQPVQDSPIKNLAARNLILNNFRMIEYVGVQDMYVFYLNKGETENDVANQLWDTGLFEYVQPNWLAYPCVIPNDTRYANQWCHPKMESPAGWDIQTGDPSVGIGVCDTGLRKTHEDFQLNVLEGYNAVTHLWEHQGGQTNDINGHGTHTSGDAAANGNNAKGITGPGWYISHRMLRVTNDPSGSASFNSLLNAALTSAQAGDKCVSVSYSGGTDPSVRSTASTVRSYGAILFWAAGNDGQNLTYPPRDNDYVVIVGATTSADVRAYYSNYGNYVDLFAPGDNIYSTEYNSDVAYGSESGTSMATPIAAGVGAMIFSNNPGWTPDQVQTLLKSSCHDVGSSGIDSVYGYGRVDLKNAMEGHSGGPITLDISPLPLNGGGRVTFNVTNGDPNAQTGVYYSLQGLGSTYINALGVTVDIASAIQAGGLKTTDSQGNASWNNLPVPHVNHRIYVWFQAAQSTGNKTSVIDSYVDP